MFYRVSGEMSKDNKTLGRFQLTGIPSARRGIPQIEVTFDIDRGIALLTNMELKSQNVVIKSTTNMSDEEIDKAVKAEQHAEEDKRVKALIEAKKRSWFDHLPDWTVFKRNGRKRSPKRIRPRLNG